MILKKFKYSLLFIFLSLITPFVIFFVASGIQVPKDLAIAGFINLILFFILRRKIEIKNPNRKVILFLTVLFSTLGPTFLLAGVFFLPQQKEHDRIMFQVCLPEMSKSYGIGEQEHFPMEPVDEKGNAKWWYQHLECEDNVTAGKGPVFSENPPMFYPIKK